MSRVLVSIILFSGLVFSVLLPCEALAQKRRVDFDRMKIRGQTKNADTLYLFDRGQLRQKSLVKPRKDYRKELLEKRFQ